MNPISGIIKYLPIYKKYTGKRIYYLFILTTLVALLDAVGITMLMPMLSLLDGNGPPSNRMGSMFHSLLTFFGAQNSLLSVIVVIITIFILKAFFIFYEGAYRGRLQANLLYELKSGIYQGYQNMNYLYYGNHNTGHFVNVINDQVNNFIGSFINFSVTLSNVVMACGYLVFSFFISWNMTLVVIIVGIIALFIFRFLNQLVKQISTQSASEMGNSSKLIIQSLHSFKYIVATNQMAHISKGVLKSLKKLASYQKRLQIMQALTQGIREPFSVLIVLSILFYQKSVLGGELSPTIVLLLLFYRGIGFIMSTQMTWQTTLNLMGSVDMVDKEFYSLKKNQQKTGDKRIDTIDHSIRINNVSFTFSPKGKKILNNINVNIPANSTIAIVGKSGAGKSTLVDLIPLLLKPNSGQVTFDGISGNEIDVFTWRKQIGYVSQDTVIFDDTIANNISLWNSGNISDSNNIKKIKEAAQKANISQYIESLPMKYNTFVGDRGIRLSGGQKQRLFIARELYKSPILLIMDEATSSLDTESERKIQKSIDNLKGTMTVVIIAHRLSTIRNANYIYVLDEGKILEEGRYDDLEKMQNSQFRSMVELQTIRR